MQLDHINLYVSDLERSRRFYEALLPNEGLVVNREHGDLAVGFGDGEYAVLALVRSPEQIQAIHLAFRFNTRADVDRLYQQARSAGARDNGAPGLRLEYHSSYYAAFVIDPDGHNLEFVCHKPSTDA